MGHEQMWVGARVQTGMSRHEEDVLASPLPLTTKSSTNLIKTIRVLVSSLSRNKDERYGV